MIRIMEVEAFGLADQQQAARRSRRAWLEENTTANAAKVRTTEATRCMGSRLAGEHCGTSARMARRRRAAFPPTISGRDVEGAHILSPVTGLGYDAVPPRALNELPDQGVEALIDLTMLIEEKREWPTLCNRIVFIAKAAGGVRPIGLLFAIVRVQCKLPRIEAEMWEARNTGRREALSGASGSRQHGVNGPRRTGHALATILYDLLKAFDHVAYHELIDAAVRTHFRVRQLKLPLQPYWEARHVELDGVAGGVLRAQRGIIPGCAFAITLLQLLVGPLRGVRAAHPTVSIRVVVDDLSLQRF